MRSPPASPPGVVPEIVTSVACLTRPCASTVTTADFVADPNGPICPAWRSSSSFAPMLFGVIDNTRLSMRPLAVIDDVDDDRTRGSRFALMTFVIAELIASMIGSPISRD